MEFSPLYPTLPSLVCMPISLLSIANPCKSFCFSIEAFFLQPRQLSSCLLVCLKFTRTLPTKPIDHMVVPVYVI
jgi:hypothetical protein